MRSWCLNKTRHGYYNHLGGGGHNCRQVYPLVFFCLFCLFDLFVCLLVCWLVYMCHNYLQGGVHNSSQVNTEVNNDKQWLTQSPGGWQSQLQSNLSYPPSGCRHHSFDTAASSFLLLFWTEGICFGIVFSSLSFTFTVFTLFSCCFCSFCLFAATLKPIFLQFSTPAVPIGERMRYHQACDIWNHSWWIDKNMGSQYHLAKSSCFTFSCFLSALSWAACSSLVKAIYSSQVLRQ